MSTLDKELGNSSTPSASFILSVATDSSFVPNILTIVGAIADISASGNAIVHSPNILYTQKKYIV